MASYSESFKISAVHEFGVLKREGILKVGNIEIKNVRELCAFLDISSQSLYRWEKKYSVPKSIKKEVFDEGEGNLLDENISDDTDFEEMAEYKEKMAKAYKNGGDIQESESELMKLHLSESNEVSKKDFFVPVQDEKKGVYFPKKSTGEKEIFNQRYYGWFAGMLGVKYYSNMLVPQLKLTIGNELIKQSELIDMNKASKKLKKNGDNL